MQNKETSTFVVAVNDFSHAGTEGTELPGIWLGPCAVLLCNQLKSIGVNYHRKCLTENHTHSPLKILANNANFDSRRQILLINPEDSGLESIF